MSLHARIPIRGHSSSASTNQITVTFLHLLSLFHLFVKLPSLPHLPCLTLFLPLSPFCLLTTSLSSFSPLPWNNNLVHRIPFQLSVVGIHHIIQEQVISSSNELFDLSKMQPWCNFPQAVQSEGDVHLRWQTARHFKSAFSGGTSRR